ncbi:glycosyltransferase [Mucilaginibacter phyllosphaerae]|uniref:Glycosyltransferase n=1 Tax=Mucilaginibacter phyllosphaerae TaxID=1812349 RepID=A0A4Y8AB55_9SPHI|nr:glycosyltransferase [Mucilaginibacter phyllosphaerae]MBB3969687.1 glycosyltransferase involved in cell wall biosynthesis [Mucilaginibacter phyllosphaerae]TEW65071.1 glycosyltransferase [Mucilaginibacter phyllosphaerae]GGH18174.1 glycosyl transferase [Mucilaginibacter phyllosphaerae]
MKVLLVNTFYYPAFDGGAEISVKLLAEGIYNNGHKAYVLTTGLTNRVYRVNGVIVISIKQKNIFNSYARDNKPLPFKLIWHLIDSCNIFYHFKVIALIKKIKPALVHTNNIQGFSPFLWLTIKSQKIPLIHSMRDYYMLCFKCNMFNGDNKANCEGLCGICKVTHTIKKNFFKYPDHFIGISQFILNKYKAYVNISKSTSVIYNAVNNHIARVDKIQAKKLHFGFIGRIARDKGVEYLVDELAKLSKHQKTEFKITFAGKGDPEFLQQIKKKLQGIECRFLGVVSPEVFYGQIDVLLVPALWNEPFGRIVIESLSYSVPVCQSDRGGLKELYNPQNSWMFSPKDGELFNLLSNILNNVDQVWQKKSKCADGLEKFSHENYINNHLEVYRQLTSNKPESSKAGDLPALLTKMDYLPER